VSDGQKLDTFDTDFPIPMPPSNTPASFRFFNKQTGVDMYNNTIKHKILADEFLLDLEIKSKEVKWNYLHSIMISSAEIAEHELSRNDRAYYRPKVWWTPKLDELLQRARRLLKAIPPGEDVRGVSGSLYRLAKRDYKDEVRRVKNKERNSYYCKLDKEKSSKPAKFWKSLGSKKNKARSAMHINGKTSSKDILKELTNVFGGRLNDSEGLTVEQQRVADEVKLYAESSAPVFDNTLYFTSEILKSSIEKLHSKRAADAAGLTAELFKYCNVPAFFVILASLYNDIVRDGVVPKEMSHSLVIPLIKKPSKGTVDPNNYRGISLISVFAKIFELGLIELFPNLTGTCDLQHGFKKHESTVHAAYTVKETISLYTSNCKSRLFMCSLDANKAFDSVWWDGLFVKLKPMLPSKIWILLYNYYRSSTFQMSHENVRGDCVAMSWGVKQGGILSPHLFTFYINELLLQLRSSGFGTRVGFTFTGAIAYADDIILLSKTHIGMQSLIDMACAYCYKWKIKLNASKTEIICFNKPFCWNEMTFTLDNNTVMLSKSCTHLGFEWRSDEKNPLESHTRTKFTTFFISTISLINKGLQSCHPDTIAFLIKNQLISLLYGIEFSDFSRKAMIYFSKSIRALYKACFRCSKYCSNALLRVMSLPTFMEIVAKRLFTTKRLIENNEYTNNINVYMRSLRGTDMFEAFETHFPAANHGLVEEDGIVSTLRGLIWQWEQPLARRLFREYLHYHMPS
jgi:hypothetical protein